MERLKIKTAVYIILEKDNKILFLRRYNTGWADGMLTLPSGHIDVGEFPSQAAVREVQEEVAVQVNIKDLKLVHVLYEKDVYIDFYFKVEKWVGEPKLAEPDKCNELKWGSLTEVGNEMVPKIKLALDNIYKGNSYSEIEEIVK